MSVTVVQLDDLTALTGSNVASGDLFHIGDVDANTSKKITAAELLNYIADNMVGNVTTVTATDAAFSTENNSLVVLNHASTDIDLTFASVVPTGAKISFLALDNGATSHTVTLAGSQTFDGTNNIASFDAANESITIQGISSTRVAVLSNVGSVAFST